MRNQGEHVVLVTLASGIGFAIVGVAIELYGWRVKNWLKGRLTE